jgi:hypothetical protein
MLDFIVFFGGGFLLFMLIITFLSDSPKKESQKNVETIIKPKLTDLKEETKKDEAVDTASTSVDKLEIKVNKTTYKDSELAKYRPTPSFPNDRERRFIKDISSIKTTTPLENKVKQKKEPPKVEKKDPPKVEKKDPISFKKTNWKDFKGVLESNSINKLYHFTDKSNIDSIKKNGGLYSWSTSDMKKISINRSGGDELSKKLDTRYGLQDYVRLSFTKNHPMMYIARKQGRISNPVILEIDIEVVYWTETRFSNMNATKNGHNEGKNLSDLNRIKFPVVKQKNHFNLDEDDKPYYQAEIMVKKFIPLKYINNINNF